MTWYSHRKFHSDHLETTLLRPDVMVAREPKRLAGLASKHHRDQKSVQMTAQMADKNSKLRAWVHGKDIKKLTSERFKELWRNPEFRDLKSRQNKEIVQRPEVREKLFGKNHWAARATAHFDLPWLLEYCRTSKSPVERQHFKYSKKYDMPCSIRVIDRIFKEHGIKSWREFQKSYLACWNHKVTKIEVLSGQGYHDVYDLEVEGTSNFLVKQGIVVHNSKATLASEDIRFSRTVAQLQKIVISEMNKLAMIHLYALGFSGDDLLNFDLKFSNPSTVAVQQKLALVSSKIEIAGKAWELSKETGILSIPYIQREILELRPEQINIIRQEARQDQVAMAELKKLAETPPFDKSLDSNIDIFDKSNYDVPTSPYAPDKKDVRDLEFQNHESERDYQAARERAKLEKGDTSTQLSGSSVTPIRFNPTPNLDKAFRRTKRNKSMTGNRALVFPDFKKMLDITHNRYAKDIYDQESSGIGKFVLEEKTIEEGLLGGEHYQQTIPFHAIHTKELQSALMNMRENFVPKKPVIAPLPPGLIKEEKGEGEPLAAPDNKLTEQLEDPLDVELLSIEKELLRESKE